MISKTFLTALVTVCILASSNATPCRPKSRSTESATQTLTSSTEALSTTALSSTEASTATLVSVIDSYRSSTVISSTASPDFSSTITADSSTESTTLIPTESSTETSTAEPSVEASTSTVVSTTESTTPSSTETSPQSSTEFTTSQTTASLTESATSEPPTTTSEAPVATLNSQQGVSVSIDSTIQHDGPNSARLSFSTSQTRFLMQALDPSLLGADVTYNVAAWVRSNSVNGIRQCHTGRILCTYQTRAQVSAVAVPVAQAEQWQRIPTTCTYNQAQLDSGSLFILIGLDCRSSGRGWIDSVQFEPASI